MAKKRWRKRRHERFTSDNGVMFIYTSKLSDSVKICLNDSSFNVPAEDLLEFVVACIPKEVLSRKIKLGQT